MTATRPVITHAAVATSGAAACFTPMPAKAQTMTSP